MATGLQLVGVLALVARNNESMVRAMDRKWWSSENLHLFLCRRARGQSVLMRAAVLVMHETDDQKLCE